MRQYGVLVVGDNHQRRAAILEALSKGGFHVAEVASVNEAVTEVASGSFGCTVVYADLEWILATKAVAVLKAVGHLMRVIVTTDQNSCDLEAAVRNEGVFYFYVRRAEGGDDDELLAAVTNALNLCRGGRAHLASPTETAYHGDTETRRHGDTENYRV